MSIETNFDGKESVSMDQVMAHLGEDDFPEHLVRYHNTQARDKLREMQVYLQMLLSRIESPAQPSVVKRIHPEEVETVSEVCKSVVVHLRNAELFTAIVAAEQHQRLTQQILPAVEVSGYGAGIANASNNGGKRVPQGNNK